MRTWDQPEGQDLPTPQSAELALQHTDCTHAMECVLGWRMVTNRRQQRGTKTVVRDSQVQYLVSWLPTLSEDWEVQAYHVPGLWLRGAQPDAYHGGPTGRRCRATTTV